MRKRGFGILALALAAVLALSGCRGSFVDDYRNASGGAAGIGGVTAYADMTYTRPDMTQVQESLSAACQAAEGDSVREVIQAVYDFYDVYDGFYTNYSLADIRYSGDLTDAYWEEEYGYCVESSAQVDAALESLYYALAQSPLREELEGENYFGAGFFDAYQEESGWDEGFLALLEQEAQLQSEYYSLSSQALDYDYGTAEYYDACAQNMAQVLVNLIALRQEIADYWGYDSYVQFAWDYYYYRDYTVADMEQYLADIRQTLVDMYCQVNSSALWSENLYWVREKDTYAYVEEMAETMGGTVAEAFALMDAGGLYDISYSGNKYNASFEVFLTSYGEPFIFMNPEQTNYDFLTFSHEFGHFCNDYASCGSYAGTDVLEVFSQGMEYLGLCYTQDSQSLTRLKMGDSLCLYVEQAAFADFEMQMYALEGEALTVENLYALYDQVAQSYGFESVDYDAREFVTITHYYTNPMYIVSYIVSNDAAMQLYQMELAESGAGLACLEENLDTQAYYFLEFLDSAGLESPFAPGRMEQVAQTLRQALAEYTGQ